MTPPLLGLFLSYVAVINGMPSCLSCPINDCKNKVKESWANVNGKIEPLNHSIKLD